MPAATPRRAHRPDPVRFVRAATKLTPVPGIPGIRFHAAHEASGLWRIGAPYEDGSEPPAPYWAFAWAGGLALATHVLAHPELVAGRRVLDLGAGSGLVAIVAARAGAAAVTAADPDRYAAAALAFNAMANGVALAIEPRDLTPEAPPPVDVILVGDLFYDRVIADRVTAFLDRCLGVGIEILIGDPGRAYLPRRRLALLAEYAVPDVGDARDGKTTGVFRLAPA